MKERFGENDNEKKTEGENVFSLDKRRLKKEAEKERVDFDLLNAQIRLLEGAIEGYGFQKFNEDDEDEVIFLERQITLCKAERESLHFFILHYQSEQESKDVFDHMAEFRMAKDPDAKQEAIRNCRMKLNQMREFLLILKNYKFDNEFEAEKERYDMLQEIL